MKKSTLLSGTVALLAVAPLHLAFAGGKQVAAPQPSESLPTTPSQVKASPSQTPGAEQQAPYGAASEGPQGYSAAGGVPGAASPNGAYAPPSAPYGSPYAAPGYGR
jgi:hypothetical protein